MGPKERGRVPLCRIVGDCVGKGVKRGIRVIVTGMGGFMAFRRWDRVTFYCVI